MDAWKAVDVNWKTGNYTRWAEILSMSAQDWDLAPFPDHVYAIPGTLDNSTLANSLPPDAEVVIQKAGRASLGRSKIESIIFAITTVIVCGAALMWIIYHWRKDTLMKPRVTVAAVSSRPGSRGSNRTAFTTGTVDEEGFLTHREYEHQLRNYYYTNVVSFHELGEKDVYAEGLAGEDVEHVIALLRQMYSLELSKWAQLSANNRAEERAADMGRKSDAVLAEVRRRIESWRVNRWDLDPEAREQFEHVLRALEELPQQRY